MLPIADIYVYWNERQTVKCHVLCIKFKVEFEMNVHHIFDVKQTLFFYQRDQHVAKIIFRLHCENRRKYREMFIENDP